MLKIFIGADDRQVVSLTTLIHSIAKNAKSPVSITPLVLDTLPIKRQGLTPFTYSRFLVPYLCGYQGLGLFLDADMLALGDVTEVFDIGRMHSDKAVHISFEQPKFERASMMMFNCAHPSNRVLTPEYIEDPDVKHLHSIGWLQADEIGSLPKEWNVCIPYTSDPPDNPKLVHFTQGVPYWWETKNQPHADKWAQYAQEACGARSSWVELMGRSVHADGVVNRLIATGEVKSVEHYMERAGLTKAAAE